MVGKAFESICLDFFGPVNPPFLMMIVPFNLVMMVTWQSRFHYYVFSVIVLRPFVFHIFTVSGVLSLHSYVYSCFSFTRLWQVILQQFDWCIIKKRPEDELGRMQKMERYINERYWIVGYRYEVQDIQQSNRSTNTDDELAMANVVVWANQHSQWNYNETNKSKSSQGETWKQKAKACEDAMSRHDPESSVRHLQSPREE